MALENDVRSVLDADFGVKVNELEDDTPIFSSGMLDSLGSVRLLLSLEDKFGVSISPLDVTLEDVDSIAKIAETVRRLQG